MDDDSHEISLQDTQRPDVYRAGCMLRTSFRDDDTMGSDLTALMLQLTRVPGIGGDRR